MLTASLREQRVATVPIIARILLPPTPPKITGSSGQAIHFNQQLPLWLLYGIKLLPSSTNPHPSRPLRLPLQYVPEPRNPFLSTPDLPTTPRSVRSSTGIEATYIETVVSASSEWLNMWRCCRLPTTVTTFEILFARSHATSLAVRWIPPVNERGQRVLVPAHVKVSTSTMSGQRM